MRFAAWCILLTGCGLAAPSTGALVEAGVGRAVFETRLAGTDLVPVTVVYPATSTGALRGKGLPAVVFVQGGFVDRARYEWQAVELAKAGYVVAIPENQLQLAFFSIDAGEAARRLLATPPTASLLDGAVDPERIAVAGHSLGSVVAVKLALEYPFNAMVLEAGFPDTADVAKLATYTRPSLSLAGSLDCSAKIDGVREGWGSLQSPTALTVLEGVTHYQFTDSQAEDDAKGCKPDIGLDDAHARIAAALKTFLDGVVRDGSIDSAALQRIDGATVEVR